MNDTRKEALSSPPLDRYLAEHFLDEPEFAALCGLSTADLSGLMEARMVPAPSYVVSRQSVLSSQVFGDLAAPGSAPGRYHRREHAVWVARALAILAETGRETAPDRLKGLFLTRLQAAADALDMAWGLPARTRGSGWADEAWEAFLNGTYGLCAVDPGSERGIAQKELLQERLVKLSGKGTRMEFTPNEAQSLLALMDAYAAATMPFSPMDYPLSSRKLLVDDLRPRLEQALQGERSLP